MAKKTVKKTVEPVDEAPEAKGRAGEADGPMSPEEKAAEKHPDSAKATNPVGEATQGESLDPYSAGHTIANPEPDNGLSPDEAHH